jgi:hypothetical protein
MSLNTPYFKWTYPEENKDPHFVDLKTFFYLVDDGTMGLLNTAGNVFIPPASVTWDPINLVLSWSGQFEIPLMSIGFSFYIPYGPDGLTPSATLSDGARLIVVVPRTASGNLTGNFQVVTSTQVIQNGLFTAGFCRGTKFYNNFSPFMS